MTPSSQFIYRNLMAVGLLGTVYRAGDDAEVINDAIDFTLQNPLQFRICRAIASGMAGNGSVAKRNLESYVEENPDDEAARLALAVSLVLSKDPEGKRAIDALLVTTTNNNVREAANSMSELLAAQWH